MRTSQACHLFLLNVLDEVRFLVERDTTVTSGEALGVTALQMMAVLVSDSRNNLWLVPCILSHLVLGTMIGDMFHLRFSFG